MQHRFRVLSFFGSVSQFWSEVLQLMFTRVLRIDLDQIHGNLGQVEIALVKNIPLFFTLFL